MARLLHDEAGVGSWLSGKMTATFVQAGRGGTILQAQRPKTSAGINKCLPPSSPPAESNLELESHLGPSLVGWTLPVSSPHLLSSLLCGLRGRPARMASMGHLAPCLWSCAANVEPQQQMGGKRMSSGGYQTGSLPVGPPLAGCVLKVPAPVK